MDKFAIPINKTDIRGFCSKYHIESLSLFGSILTKHFKDTSDIDILVKFDKDYIPTIFDMVDMELELGHIFGRKVDLKTSNELSSYFRNDVLAKAKMIYGKQRHH